MCGKLTGSVCFVLLLGLAANVANAGLTNGLVGYYPLDEGAGNTAYDMSGNEHNGTLYNGVTWISPGFINGAVNFDGTTNTRIELGTWNPAGGTGRLSLALWIRWAGGGGTYQGLIGKRNTWPETTMFQFQVRPENNGTFRLETGTYAVVSPNGTLAPFVRTWAHVAATFDGTTCRLYLNGEEIMSGGFALNTAGETSNMGIGCVTGGGEGYSGNGEVFLGDIDEVYIYNRALSGAEIKSLAARYSASNPTPADGAVITQTAVALTWAAGTYAVSHHVYLGTSFDEVYNGTPGTDKGPVPWPAYWAPDLELGKTYYWRVDEVSPTHPDSPWRGPVWSFTIPPKTAWMPNPADGAKFIDPNVTLRWSAGVGAFLHHVYFGEDFDRVNNADTSDTTGIYKGPQSLTFHPGPLELEKVYYWRVDEFDGIGVYKGAVWGFTTVGPYAGVEAEYYHWTSATIPPSRSATFNTRVLTRTESEINHHWGGGSPDPLVNVDQFAGRWTADLEVAFSEPYTFWTLTDDGVRVWLDGELIIDDWNDHGDTWNSSQPIDLVAGQRYALVMEWFENAGGATAELDWASPSMPRQVIPAGPLQLPLKARNPSPAHGATDVKHTPTLRWSAGEEAAKHNVYLGTDPDAVANATTASAGIYRGQQNLDATSYVPTESPLAWGTTYYWRIDEVNGVDVWKGTLWSFTTANCLIVEDFEEYNDFCNRIFYKWKDGWGYSADPDCGVTASTGNGTGSTVGNLSAPFAEQTIVHSGIQSMPFEYNNTGTGGKTRYSEASLEFAVAQNWTTHDMKGFNLWFYGQTGNTPETLYVAVQDSTGQVRVATHPNPEALQLAGWQPWYINLQQFSGLNLASVKKLYIGVGNRSNPAAGGSGKLYIDDIRVCPPTCVPSMGKPAADLSGNCIVDYADVEIVSDQWLDSGFVVTPTDPGNSGLISYYPFNGNANDVVGGHNGTITGIVSYGAGKIGQAIILDGVDDYVKVGSVGISGAAPRTIAGWVRAHATVDSLPDWINIFGFSGPSGNDGHFDIELVNAGGVRGYGAHVYGWERNIMPIDLDWHHLAASYDGTTIAWYGDGRLIGTDSSRTLNTPDNVHMGRREDYDNYFPGRVDEVRIFNRALSDGEVASLAGHTSPLSIPADLYQDDVIDFQDLAVLGDSWLDKVFWP